MHPAQPCFAWLGGVHNNAKVVAYSFRITNLLHFSTMYWTLYCTLSIHSNVHCPVYYTVYCKVKYIEHCTVHYTVHTHPSAGGTGFIDRENVNPCLIYIVLNILHYMVLYIVLFIKLGLLHIRVLRSIYNSVFRTLCSLILNTIYFRQKGHWSSENKPVRPST